MNFEIDPYFHVQFLGSVKAQNVVVMHLLTELSLDAPHCSGL